MDKAGQSYWDRGYKEMAKGAAVHGFDPGRGRVRDYWKQQFHAYFQRAFRNRQTRGQRLIEVGAGGSAILPYLAREFGFQVVGLDYSPDGCAMAERILRREGISGEVVCADVFDPPASQLGQADVLVSFGVVEHFSDPADCVLACAKLLKPGGLMITTVPNMAGLVGRLQHALDPAVFEKHVALDASRLASAHERAGMVVLDSRYVLFAHFGVININETRGGVARMARATALASLKGISWILWFLEQHTMELRPNAFTSPYVFCLAQKPSA